MAKDLEEAFCRDIDSFNSAYITDDGSRPANCPEVPINYCAMLFDSKDCTGGWSLNATDGTEMNFYYFSSNWKYRNDLDTIGLRFGCTFTGFSSTGFSGNKMILTADTTDSVGARAYTLDQVDLSTPIGGWFSNLMKATNIF